MRVGKYLTSLTTRLEREQHDTLPYRVAVSSDEAGILDVFAEVAPEVPTAVRPQTKGIIQGLVDGGQSLVAVDASGKIVGYALAETVNNATSLVYVGVVKAARKQHVASNLIAWLKDTGKPIVTDVRSDNKSSMVERFERLGFAKSDVDERRTVLRFTPDISLPRHSKRS